ncbi:hypothetical protein, partial [Xanthovirga aplysinae]|uniref:hypothetical protein n=1 Tax=Xanthovirga aplysinae TaxID=2529853 RepID=UPI003CCE4E43
WYDERGLSDIAFTWHMDRASNCGLKLRKGWKKSLTQNPLAPLHNSRTGLWRLWPAVERSIPPGAKLHQSVMDRINGLPNYRPDLPSCCFIVSNENYAASA